MRKAANESKFLSGGIEVDGKKISLLIFPNGFQHENPKAPNYIAYLVPNEEKPQEITDEEKLL